MDFFFSKAPIFPNFFSDFAVKLKKKISNGYRDPGVKLEVWGRKAVPVDTLWGCFTEEKWLFLLARFAFSQFFS